MANGSKFTLEQVLAECENTLNTLGFCSYTEVSRRLGVSRQAIQKRLQAATRRGDISSDTAERYRYTGTILSKRFNTCLTPENYDFMVALAEQLKVHPAYILQVAVNRYRMSLRENAAGLMSESLLRGLEQARKGKFVDPPDLDEDEKLAAEIPD